MHGQQNIKNTAQHFEIQSATNKPRSIFNTNINYHVIKISTWM